MADEDKFTEKETERLRELIRKSFTGVYMRSNELTFLNRMFCKNAKQYAEIGDAVRCGERKRIQAGI